MTTGSAARCGCVFDGSLAADETRQGRMYSWRPLAGVDRIALRAPRARGFSASETFVADLPRAPKSAEVADSLETRHTLSGRRYATDFLHVLGLSRRRVFRTESGILRMGAAGIEPGTLRGEACGLSITIPAGNVICHAAHGPDSASYSASARAARSATSHALSTSSEVSSLCHCSGDASCSSRLANAEGSFAQS
jgi:hypothetical protein